MTGGAALELGRAASRLDTVLAEAVGRAEQRAARLGRSVLVSVSVPVTPLADVLDFTAGARDDEAERFVWQRPADRFACAALGAALTLPAHGPERFATLARACAAVTGDAVMEPPDAAAPLFVGGFAFRDEVPADSPWQGFPAAQLVVPRRMLAQDRDGATLTANVMVGSGQRTAPLRDLAAAFTEPRRSVAAAPALDTEPALRYEATPGLAGSAWRDAVAATLCDIRAGRLEKLVLARSCHVRATRPFDCARIVRALGRTYPGCATFWIRTRQASFVGATPEPLVRLDGGEVSTAAVAGSIARDPSPAADAGLRGTLATSAKDGHEHALVVRAIADALGPVCGPVRVPPRPSVAALANVQHLVTPITARLTAPRGILDLVARLHPSPAVAGAPVAAALAALREREPLERGWYAGPVGWMRRDGGGEFAVALRSALIRGAEATLFAGAGIVAGSDAEVELAETRLKLQAMLSALLEL
jgi:isochorismate synthase